MSNYSNAIPAGFEDDEDSDDDLWYRPDTEMNRQNGHDKSKDVNQRNETNGNVTPEGKKEVEKVCDIEDFRLAVAAGKSENARAMLTPAFDVNAVSRSGWSPLMYAAEVGDLETCRALLTMGANPNHHVDNYSVLMAASKGRGRDGTGLAVVKLLVNQEKVQIIDAKDRYHSTPLMYAAQEGHTDIVQYYTEECKLSVDTYDARGNTALMAAVRRGQVDAARVLLKAGADKNKINIDGKTAKEMAMDSGNVDLINLLHDNTAPIGALDAYNEVTRYGELENFFYGLQLHDLIDVFKRHKIEFKQMILLSEADLLQIGVKMGDVKKLSEAIHAIHKQPWQKTSLHRTDPKSRIILKCSDAVAMISNISKHSSLMCSSVGYTVDQIKAHDSVLDSGIDNGSALQLRQAAKEALANVKALLREVETLNSHLNDPKVKEQTQPVDRVDEAAAKMTQRRLRPRLSWCILGFGVGSLGAAVIILSQNHGLNPIQKSLGSSLDLASWLWQRAVSEGQ